MKRFFFAIVMAIVTLLPTSILAQYPYVYLKMLLKNRTSYDMMKEMWDAAWIDVDGAKPKDYGVYYFRKDINLATKPTAFKVYVSGDTRYKLYVNGELVSLGPARSDSKHWNYETVDLAPYLKASKNALAAQVWNEGSFTPVPNATVRTGFLMMGEGDAKVVNTDESWKGIQDPAYNSGDDTLWKNFLIQSDMSRNAEDVTIGRAPSELAQYITPYALSYIYSIHDYMRYGKDQALVLDLIPGAEQIIHYFNKYQEADGRIKGLPGWNFSDWVISSRLVAAYLIHKALSR